MKHKIQKIHQKTIHKYTWPKQPFLNRYSSSFHLVYLSLCDHIRYTEQLKTLSCFRANGISILNAVNPNVAIHLLFHTYPTSSAFNMFHHILMNGTNKIPWQHLSLLIIHFLPYSVANDWYKWDNMTTFIIVDHAFSCHATYTKTGLCIV
jgi:hypothetical protein